MPKMLVTSSGCYATDTDGKTVELQLDQELILEAKQANKFIKAGKAKLVLNETDASEDELADKLAKSNSKKK